MFAPPPAETGVTGGEPLENQVIVDWRSSHPVLGHVDLGAFFAAKAWRLVPPPDGLVLAEFRDAPTLVIVRRHGGVFFLAGFDLLQTTWPFEPGFVMFCYNVIAFVGNEAANAGRYMLEVGDPITMQTAGGGEATVLGPDGSEETIASDPAGTFRYAATGRAGLYRLTLPAGTEEYFAVNVLDEKESDTEPAAELVLPGEVAEAQTSDPVPANRELWPFLAALALLMVCLEWYVYSRKVAL